MKNFTLTELEKLEFKDIDMEVCLGTPKAQAAFLSLCYLKPELKDMLVLFVRDAFLTGLRVMCDATKKELHVQ